MQRNKPCIELVDEQMVKILRHKTPAEKVAMIAAAHRTARLIATGGVRYQHPDWTEEQVQSEVLRRMAGGTR